MTQDATQDTIRDAIVARVKKLGLTPYALSQRCEGKPGIEAIRRYLLGRVSLNSLYVSRLCGVLGLELTVAEKS
jgi:hypothetical protein